MIENMMILAGNANRELAVKIADYLSVPLGNATVGRFSDGEIAVEIGENIRNMDVFIIQPTCAPTNDSLMVGYSVPGIRTSRSPTAQLQSAHFRQVDGLPDRQGWCRSRIDHGLARGSNPGVF